MPIAGGIYQFTDNTHPEANGRTRQAGEAAFQIKLPLQYGENLLLNLGAGGLAVLMAWGSVAVGNDNALWDEIDKLTDELAQEDAPEDAGKE